MLFLSGSILRKLNIFGQTRIDVESVRKSTKIRQQVLQRRRINNKNSLEIALFGSSLPQKNDEAEQFLTKLGLFHLSLQEIEVMGKEEITSCYQKSAEQKLQTIQDWVEEIIKNQSQKRNCQSITPQIKAIQNAENSTLMNFGSPIPIFFSKFPEIQAGNKQSYKEFVFGTIIVPYISFLWKRISSNFSLSISVGAQRQELWKIINYYRSFLVFSKKFCSSLRYYQEKLLSPILLIVQLLDYEIKLTFPKIQRFFVQFLHKLKDCFEFLTVLTPNKAEKIEEYSYIHHNLNLHEVNSMMEELFTIRDGFSYLYRNKFISKRLKQLGKQSPSFFMLEDEKTQILSFILKGHLKERALSKRQSCISSKKEISRNDEADEEALNLKMLRKCRSQAFVQKLR